MVQRGELASAERGKTGRAARPGSKPPALPDSQTLTERSASSEASYYLYTSGTTGKPKCVVLNNRATANVIGQTLHAGRSPPMM